MTVVKEGKSEELVGRSEIRNGAQDFADVDDARGCVPRIPAEIGNALAAIER